MPNPFYYGGRIENPNDFIGRKSELRTIFSALETFSSFGQAQHISVVGERRIGKSSLLYYVTQTYRQHLSHPEQYRFILVDLQQPLHHTLRGLLGSLLDKLDVASKAKPSLSEFAEEIEKLHDRKKVCAVICLDEFEQLVNHKKEFPDSAYEALRSLGSNNKIAFITASKMQLSEIIQQSNMTSTFPNIFIHLPLRAFNQAEAIQLLDRASPQFTMAEKEKIIYLSAGIPWKLQFIAQRAYDKRETGILNWEEIKQECERQTGYANSQRHNSTQSNKTNALLSSIFIQAPQWIGYAVLGVIKDKDKINGQSALLCGYIVLLILTGVLSYQQIKMALPFLP